MINVMAMSQDQSEFIRKLKITLISVLTPFILSGIVVSITNHQRINSNEKHIEALDQTRVSREVMLLYVNELRVTNELLRKEMEGQGENAKELIGQLTLRLDGLMNDVYEVKKRSLPPGHKLN